ncbi:hypothetical protein NE236_13070 [Actinoallomurus purpureus]|uniref:hypothetical protein n=1 Tax=Actinoallomurus purpureus TaxID=478114 RepID=UPI002092863E|nr:hypothetical protein [Actinoallomurus purpureus]MCO6005917.1 hypothetical protein [Actinoallomurus purpureus]
MGNGAQAPGWDGQQPAAWNGGHPLAQKAQQPPAWNDGHPPGQGTQRPGAWNGGRPPQPEGRQPPAWNGAQAPGSDAQQPPAWNGGHPPGQEAQQPGAWNGGAPPPDGADDPNADADRDPDEAPRRARPSLRLPAIKLPARPVQHEKGPGALPPVAYFAAAGVVLIVALVAVAGLVVLLHDDPKTASPQPGAVAAGGPLPSVYSAAPSTSVFGPIAKRSADPSPLTENEVFDKKTISDGDSKASLKLTASKLDARCADAVWGQALVGLLQQSGCTQATRGVYTDKRFSAMVAIFNVADSRAADKLVAAADPGTGDGFARPLGDEAAFGQGFSTARGVAMGHYAVITWVRRTDGTGSETDPKLVSLLVTLGPPPAIVARVADQGQKK